MDKRKNNGGARLNAGRKKGIGISFEIQKYCYDMIESMLKNDAIRLKATKQLSLLQSDLQEDYLYIIENNGLYKIGYSSNWDKRFKNYQTHLGQVNIVYVTKQPNCFELERHLHNLFSDKRLNGEWFDLDETDLLEAIKFCSSSL